MAIIAVTQRPRELREFLVELAGECNEEVEVETSGAGALERMKSDPPKLVVIDHKLPDFKPLKLVVETMKVSAMTHTAVVTTLSPAEFHEASEGYGVLMSLPPAPDAEAARDLAEALDGVQS